MSDVFNSQDNPSVMQTISDLYMDRKRLEWLVENQCYPMPTKSGWCLTEEGCSCRPETDAKSWRDAIDEAMKGE